MKKLLTWGGVGLLTSALLDPVIQGVLEQPVHWGQDFLMGVAGAVCIWLLIKFRHEL